uniref:Uncharacterized protein n=1 Tax=Anopheles albimanus TaxID=7167 RepID=A0A1I8JSN0_ANOAL
MRSLIIGTILLVVIFLAQSVSCLNRCGAREELLYCSGSPGCFCVKGTVRIQQHCVPESACRISDVPINCGPNEVVQQCGHIIECRCRPGWLRFGGQCYSRLTCRAQRG